MRQLNTNEILAVSGGMGPLAGLEGLFTGLLVLAGIGVAASFAIGIGCVYMAGSYGYQYVTAKS